MTRITKTTNDVTRDVKNADMVTILPVRFLLYTLNVKRDRLPGDQESRATQNTLVEQAYKTELLASSQHISCLQIFGAAQNSQGDNLQESTKKQASETSTKRSNNKETRKKKAYNRDDRIQIYYLFLSLSLSLLHSFFLSLLDA
jgi:hypothetical protein